MSDTINSKRMYVGDRAKIKESGREGEVMYFGLPSFSSKEIVGMRLDEKRSKSDCDGKSPNGERLFRCLSGFGIFLGAEDVEVLPRVDGDAFPQTEPPEDCIDVEEELGKLVGLGTIKAQVKKVKQLVEVQKKREGLGVFGGKPLHFGFRASHGCGVSSVARLMAHMLRDLEVSATGQLVEISRKELMSGLGSHGDVEKQMAKLWKAATGGMLLVNDAHLLQDRERSRDEAGVEACEWLAKQLDQMNQRGCGEASQPVWPQPVVVALAHPKDSQLPDALQKVAMAPFDFPDFSNEDLAEILVRLVDKRKFGLDKGVTKDKLQGYVRNASSRAVDNEKNIVMLQKMLDEAIQRQTERVWTTETVSLAGLTTLSDADFVDTFTPSRDDAIKAALAKLDGVVGLKGVKTFIHSLYAQIKTEMDRREAGIKGSSGAGTLHMIFTGNPGTGKTTVARIVAELLASMGLLRKGHLVEADRGALVAGYSGQTAIKTKQVVETAMGGVLFVDEAYALVAAGEGGKDAFGHEALDTLIKMIEDRRQDLVVILAGYPDEMERLIAANPGVRSRFPVNVNFEDYNNEELMQIAERMLLDEVLVLSPAAEQALARRLQAACKGSAREHGNGRAVRNILERGKRRMAVRLQEAPKKSAVRSQSELCTLEADDFEE